MFFFTVKIRLIASVLLQFYLQEFSVNDFLVLITAAPIEYNTSRLIFAVKFLRILLLNLGQEKSILYKKNEIYGRHLKQLYSRQLETSGVFERMIFFEIIFLLMCISLVMTQSNSSYGFDVEHFPGEECFRPCSDSKPRMCYFKWNLEYYTAMGL